MRGYPTSHNGMIFIEAPVEEGRKVGAISADLSFKFGAHLKTLNDVKEDLAIKAGAMGCNCVSEFKYGQKSRLLAIDDVAYFGSGVAVQLTIDSYQRILEYIAQRDSPR